MMRSTLFNHRGTCQVVIDAARSICLAGSILLPALVRADDGTAATLSWSEEQQIRFFETKIRPIFADHCYECHGAAQQDSELRLDTVAGIMKGGKAGPAVVGKKPAGSLLLTAVRYLDSELQMPPDGQLPEQHINDLTKWIERGAAMPGGISPPGASDNDDVAIEAGRAHWAFQAIKNPTPPRGRNGSTSVHPIDAFLAERWTEAGLRPMPLAEKTVLLRRATYDLTGLPPSIAEIDSFLADDSPQAFERVIDRLLASPRYGERWGRHWLDVARYADSNGLDENVAHGNAWRYRDYVVESFNADKPYDDFITEQLAGDLLDSANNTALRNERLIATGYLVLGPKVLAEKDQTKMKMDIIDEQLDTIGRGILGLTLGCARCHSHKFDPTSHSDYYGLVGIFESTLTMDSYATVAQWHENPIEASAQAVRREEHAKKLVAKEQQIADLLAKEPEQFATETDIATDELEPDELKKRFEDSIRLELKSLRDELERLKSSLPEIPTAMGVSEAAVVDTAIHLRGSHLTLGDVVPRRFPTVLVATQPRLPKHHSGRLEFAQWLTNGQHPLTARVMVNRVWRGHFGRGLVPTVDNFGLQGERPTHSELFDWLANDFVLSGWSIKSLHRTIMLSDAYQRSSEEDSQNRQIDVDNRLYWRFDLQRLEAEAIRDGILSVSGQLDQKMGGNLMELKNREYVFNHTSEDKSSYEIARRSIYLPVIRNHLFDMFTLFDFTDASVLNGDRESSTIATQALFLMNSQFMIEHSSELADRLLKMSGSKEERIVRLYRLAFGRPPTVHEKEQANEFLHRFEALLVEQQSPEEDGIVPRRRAWQSLCQAILSSSEFVYVR